MVRTPSHKLVVRPQGQSELYHSAVDPLEERNLFGESSVTELQLGLERKLLYWYLNTTGIAPFDKDQRSLPHPSSHGHFLTITGEKLLTLRESKRGHHKLWHCGHQYVDLAPGPCLRM